MFNEALGSRGNFNETATHRIFVVEKVFQLKAFREREREGKSFDFSSVLGSVRALKLFKFFISTTLNVTTADEVK